VNQPLPKYYKIYEDLLNDIRKGRYHENRLFPSDNELVKIYDVSRGTIREAIKLLLQQGYLIRKQGKGTYVTYKKIEQDPDRLIGFTELMKQHDLKPSAKIIKKEITAPDANISHLMRLSSRQYVVRLVRLRFGNNQPLIIERSFFNYDLFKPIYDMDLEQNSIFELLYRHTATRLGNALQRIEAVSAGREENTWLEVDLHTPLLLIKRLIKTTEDTIFQYSEDVYRSDRINFSTQTVPYNPDNRIQQLPLNLTEKDWD
jgi:GntR family transcriptional regulator